MFFLPLPYLVHFNQTRSLLGVRHKLVAVETQLGKYPPWSGKYNEVAAGGVNGVALRVNSRFGALTYQPVVFFAHAGYHVRSVFGMPDGGGCVFFCVRLREGMAPRTHEYVQCHEGA